MESKYSDLEMDSEVDHTGRQIILNANLRLFFIFILLLLIFPKLTSRI